MIKLHNNSAEEINNKEDMLAMLSHDLKNPVISTLLAINLLNNCDNLNDFQKELIENMKLTLEYAKNLISNVLDMYKLDNKVYKIEKTLVNFKDFVTSVIKNNKYITDDKKQVIKFVDNLSENVNLNLDIIGITRVINNLISNASNYSLNNSEIFIKIFDDKNHVGFSIKNFGHEICNPDKIFEKFVSENNNLSLSSGLGLYIVKKIISNNNGKIFVQSINNSTEITFLLLKE